MLKITSKKETNKTQSDKYIRKGKDNKQINTKGKKNQINQTWQKDSNKLG